MAYTVTAAFQTFFNRINVSSDHRDTANTRRDRLVSLLQNEFDIRESFATGSLPRFTAIRGHTDLDITVALHYSKHIKGRKPSQVLQSVRNSLANYRTDLRRNGQAVTLHYETWPNVDIVPVSRFVNASGLITHYNVPNMHTETWIKSRPNTHSKNIRKRVAIVGAEFRHVVKMLKWWNKQHSDLLNSYHIEVIALHSVFAKFDSYPWDMFYLFNRAYDLVQNRLWHDVGYADAYLHSNSNRRSEILKRLSTARSLARTAWYETHGARSNHAEAIRIWRKIFGEKFPPYGS